MSNLCSPGRIFGVFISAFLALLSQASAQTSDLTRFSPLPQGGYWEYEMYDYHSSTEIPQPYVYVSYSAESDTLIGRDTFTVLEERKFDGHRNELSTQRCGVRITTQNKWQLIGISSEDGSCPLALEFLFRYNLHIYSSPKIYGDQSIDIGGQTYEVSAVADAIWYTHGTGGSNSTHRRGYAEGIGQYSEERSGRSHPQAGGEGRSYKHKLIYASVGGRAFGVSAVSTDHPPGPADAYPLIQSISPNPFGDEIRVTLQATSATAVDYTVFDALGRRISSGTFPLRSTAQTIRLDASPAGLYFIELRDRNGHRDVRPLVRVPLSDR